MSYAEAWLNWSHILEAGAAPLTARMIELGRVSSASSILDIGTGIGEPGLSAARLMRHPGLVLGLDPDPRMIALARERARDRNIQNIDFEVASLENIDLRDQSFDVVLARWSLMFVSDFRASIARVRKALRPGGHFVAATWATPDRVPALSLAKSVIHRHFGFTGSPHKGVRTFALSEEAEIASILREAGFHEVTTEPFDVTYEFSSALEFIRYRLEVAGPLWAGMETSTAEETEGAFAAIGSALEAYKHLSGGYRLANQAICISCRA